MLLLWDLYWPALAAAFLIGTATGLYAWRRGRRRGSSRIALAAGLGIALGATALWHGPVGTAGQLRQMVERDVRATLENYEMDAIGSSLGGSPLSRTMFLSGPADSFQRGELVRIIGYVPGVSDVRWADAQDSRRTLPLLVEVELWTLGGFGLALLFAYLIELRRRARADWRW